jgi:site-specific recombinase XerD
MTTIDISATVIHLPEDEFGVDEAHLAAVAFLARYNGRTLDAYRHDLRGFFQWSADNSLDVLAATRPHIEWYRSWMEERSLAASTIDRRLSTVCGFYRFAHIDGGSRRTRRSTYADRRSTRRTPEGWTVRSWACSCSRPRTSTAITPRSRSCSV